MIATLADFSPKDYEKVMQAINKAHIELVDKLPEDEPTAEDLNSMLLPTDEPDTEVMLEDEVALDDYHEAEEHHDEEEEADADGLGYYSDEGIVSTYTYDPIRMYLKEIGNFTLISSEDEVKLAKRINKGRAAVLIMQGEPSPEGEIDYSEWSDEEIIKKFNDDIRKEKEITGQRSIAKLLSRLKRRKAAGNPYSLEEYKKAAARLTKAEHRRLLKFAQDDNCYIEGMEEVDVDNNDIGKEVAYLYQIGALFDEIKLREIEDIGGFTVAESEALYKKLLTHIEKQ